MLRELIFILQRKLAMSGDGTTTDQATDPTNNPPAVASDPLADSLAAYETKRAALGGAKAAAAEADAAAKTADDALATARADFTAALDSYIEQLNTDAAALN